MGKAVDDSVLDAALNDIKNNCTRQVLCSQQPTTFNEANSTYMLSQTTMAAGDFTVGNGDTSGRKVTMAAKNGTTVTNTGTATHAALLDVVNSVLLYVTTVTSQALTAGNTVNIGSWKAEIQDPT
jgi:hypothetical protein